MTQTFSVYPDAWESMLEDCKAAKSYIYFEQFIWQDFDKGKIGDQFLQIFKRKVKEGVKVRLIIDSVGSIGLFTNPFRQNEIREAGIEMEFFGIVPRWKSLFPFNMFHRDHRKIIIVDGEVAHVGGVIISERSRDWQDIDVRLVDSKYVKEVKGAFLRMWDEIREKEDHEDEYDTVDGVLLKTDPENNDLHAEILQRIKNADRKISIVSPYFSPDWKMLRALRAACRRGVTVDIILPDKCDSKLTSMVTASYVRQLRRYKIGVHFYFTCMNHGKLVMVDDWVTLGSMNFDRLSFFYNRELNVILENDPDHFTELIDDLKSRSNIVDRSYIRKQGIRFKIAAFVGKIFRPIA